MTEKAGRVLVTGGAGFLGRRVVRELVRRGHRVRALLRPGGAASTLGAGAADGDAIEPVWASLTDRGAIAAALQDVEVVIHVAASKTGSVAAQVANTVVGTDHLCRASADAGVRRFVLVGSLGALGAAAVPRGGVVDELTPLEPRPEWRDPYSFAKVRQEQVAWAVSRELSLPLVVVRPGVIFGPGESLLTSRVGLFVGPLFLHLGQGAPVPLTYVDNCADAVVRAGFAEGAEGHAFCVVDDDLPRSRDLLRAYRSRVRPVPFVPVPASLLRLGAHVNRWYSRRTHDHLPPVFTPYKVDVMWTPRRYSNGRAKAVLGWRPEVPMVEALERTLRDQPSAAA